MKNTASVGPAGPAECDQHQIPTGVENAAAGKNDTVPAASPRSCEGDVAEPPTAADADGGASVTSVSAPVTSASAPVTSVSAPVTSVSAPVTSVSAPVTPVSAPVTSVSAPVTSVSAPVPSNPPPPANHAESAAPLSEALADCSLDGGPIVYSNYESELQMPEIMQLIQRDLSEPYSIYTYRYFINNWPNLCFLARHAGRIVGAIVCKLDSHDSHTKRAVTSRGYIAMLAVDQRFRKRRIGSCLVLNAIRAMAADAADEVVLETEVTNKGALRLYENLGFVRDKRLFRYYLNGVDALRLKLWLWPP